MLRLGRPRSTQAIPAVHGQYFVFIIDKVGVLAIQIDPGHWLVMSVMQHQFHWVDMISLFLYFPIFKFKAHHGMHHGHGPYALSDCKDKHKLL